MKFIKSFIVASLACLLQACFNSEDYIFDEAETTDIIVEATLAKSMGDFSNITKADTFHISDTIYFLTTVSPSKSIKVQDFHWLMDGKYCSSEYNFKKQINEPGHHEFTFVLKDYYGDMHYDTLNVWIADKPILNDAEFTPAEGTQAIDPYESIYFTWSAKTEKIKLAHRYHFTLSEQNYANTESKFNSIDTILNEPHFIYHNKLNPFKKYNWTVQAFNEYNFASSEKIESFFFTKGLDGEGSLQATIKTSVQSSIPVHLSLTDKTNENKVFNYEFSISQSKNKISVGAVPKGSYKLELSSNYSDFGTTKKDVTIHEGLVTTLDNIKLVDSIAPSITSVLNLDTLDFSDTLHFVIKDEGGPINSQNIAVHLESDIITDRFYKDSILTVILKETDKSWTYRILTISVIDGSNNNKTKSFYITPSSLWFTTNDDTIIESDESIVLFINDINPFGFKVATLQLFNVTKNEDIITVPNIDNNSLHAELGADLFDKEQITRSTVIYTNGITQNKYWKLTVRKAETKEED